MDFRSSDGYQGQANSRANIAESERLPSLVLGGCLTAFGLVQRTPASIALGALGAMMIYRGVTSHCPINSALGVNRAPADHNPDAVIGHLEGIKVDKSVTIVKPQEELYGYWKNFENLPTFMDHLVAVTNLDNKRSHWVAKAPAGRTVEWDEEIINEVEKSVIAWKTTGDADITHAGAVTFKPAVGGRGTVVRVELEYKAPGGTVGALAAKLFGEEPSIQVESDLRHFKQLMETGELATASADHKTYGRGSATRY